MNLYILRTTYTPVSTVGELIVNHSIFCHTLEDVVRPKGSAKVPGKTAIPSGRYTLLVNESNRFKRQMPLIQNVPGFEGIRMHGGNTAEDTEGCILVAKTILNSKTIQGAMEKELTELLLSKKENHYIEIIDTFPYSGV